MGAALSRLAPDLQAAGIAVKKPPRKGDRRAWRLEKSGTRTSQMSPPSPTGDLDEKRGDVEGERTSLDRGAATDSTREIRQETVNLRLVRDVSDVSDDPPPESADVECPHCGSPSVGDWGGGEFDCNDCGRRFRTAQGA
jgi:hypothetical protein